MSETSVPSPKPAPPAKGRRAFKTVQAWLPKEAAAAARAVSRHGRDIENTTLYLLNADRTKAAAEPRKPGEKEKKLTLVPELG